MSIRHLQHHKLQTGILVACIALSVFLPVTTQVLARQYEADLKARANATPLVLGTRGNATELAARPRLAPSSTPNIRPDRDRASPQLISAMRMPDTRMRAGTGSVA